MRRILATRLWRMVLVVGFGLAMSWPTGVAGQTQAQVATAVRGPRFLAASRVPKGAPVAVDVHRNALLRKVVSLNFRQATLGQVLTSIERQTGLSFFYSREALRADRPVSLRAESITVAAALMEILMDTGVDVLLSGGMQIALIERTVSKNVALGGSIVGQVTDTNKRGLAGVDVFLEGTPLRVTTDTAGRYRIGDVDVGTYTLAARRVGYAKLSRQVTVRNGQEDTVNLMLAPLVVALDELVSTATGQQRRRDIGNAITTIRADSLLQAAPIRNLTDLLEGRVPGLTVQHTSGAPGDPARLRLRGIGSVLRGNDPVVIVDGVRIYAAQSEERSGNLTNLGARLDCRPINGCNGQQVLSLNASPAPSPLDQIDPNIIEKIEVFKGPSAATLYGPDAANGVIVVTTKKGRPGPTRWDARVSHGRTDTPGRWPNGYYRWGRIPEQGGGVHFCTITDLACDQDSLVQFQALNDPNLTVLGKGKRTELSLTASGGSKALTYSVTGTYADEIGLLKLPDFEVERFRSRFTREPDEWMRRPHSLKTWSVSSNITAVVGPTADLSLFARLERTEQQRSSLESKIELLAGIYVDSVNDFYYVPSNAIGSSVTLTNNYIPEYFELTTATQITFTTGLNGTWRPRSWFNLSARAGLDVSPREDLKLRPGGIVKVDDNGALIFGVGRMLVSTIDMQGLVRKPLGWGFNFETSVGTNLTTRSQADLVSYAVGLVPSTTAINGASNISASEMRANTSVFGWFIEPRISGERLSLSTGIRLDGGSTYGTRISGNGGLGSLLSLPKLNGSWVVSEESFFPFKSLFSSLRLRGAYGQAQVQPGPKDRLRIYTQPFGRGRGYYALTGVGNADLRPERSVEFEGGLDADLLDGRVSLEITAYRKTQIDAHMPVELPSSVNGGGTVVQNIGNIRNSGLELVVGLTPLQAPVLTWSTQLMYSHNANTLVKLGEGVVTNKLEGLVEGYPVRGRWSRPILGYADENNNGVLERTEIRLGDSLDYMGRLLPAYTAALSTNLVLFGGAIGIAANFSYETGGTQVDETARRNWVLSRALVDPATPFNEQAAVLAMDSTEYGMTQDISTFRFRSFSVNYRAPAQVARLLRSQSLTVGIQGANLGLYSTYRGKDPDVSVWSSREVIRDTGQLPVPRTWQLMVSLQY